MTTLLGSYRDDLPPLDRGPGLGSVGPSVLLVLGVAPAVTALVNTKEAGLWVGLTLAWFILLGSVCGSRSRFTWLVPATLRAAEYGFVIGTTYWVDPSALPAAFVLLAALSYHHYDLIYRPRYQGSGPPRWVLVALGGWQVRTGVVFVIAAADLLTPGLWILACWIGLLAIGESANSWRSAAPEPATTMDNDDDAFD